MSRMLELVRTNALSWHQMMTASKGALQVPGEEMVEILVYIADHNKIMGDQARLTLAGWDEAATKKMASNPDSPKEVLNYWVAPRNLRPALFPLLLENASVSNTKLGELAATLKGQWIDVMMASPRVRNSRHLLSDLASNKELSVQQAALVKELIDGKPADAAELSAGPTSEIVVAAAAVPAEAHVVTAAPSLAGEPDPEADAAIGAFFAEHASEIAAEGDKPFQAIGGIYDATPAEAQERSMAAAASATPVPAASAAAAPAVTPVLPKQHVNPENEKRGSVLQKINKLDIKGRIQLAMKGNKEERSILVRDGTKIVALAVLDSPKISDGEVEKFASQRNVLEAVLRAIPMKRRFMKNYAVVRNLVFNPRTPIDVSLGLMKNLLVADLRNLCGNKEVADTIRKLALRNFKQKSEQAGKK
jgi:hypothetical protein